MYSISYKIISNKKFIRKENAFLNNLESFSLEQEFHIYKYLKYLSYNQSSVCIEIPWLDVDINIGNIDLLLKLPNDVAPWTSFPSGQIF